MTVDTIAWMEWKGSERKFEKIKAQFERGIEGFTFVPGRPGSIMRNRIGSLAIAGKKFGEYYLAFLPTAVRVEAPFQWQAGFVLRQECRDDLRALCRILARLCNAKEIVYVPDNHLLESELYSNRNVQENIDSFKLKNETANVKLLYQPKVSAYMVKTLQKMEREVERTKYEGVIGLFNACIDYVRKGPYLKFLERYNRGDYGFKWIYTETFRKN